MIFEYHCSFSNVTARSHPRPPTRNRKLDLWPINTNIQLSLLFLAVTTHFWVQLPSLYSYQLVIKLYRAFSIPRTRFKQLTGVSQLFSTVNICYQQTKAVFNCFNHFHLFSSSRAQFQTFPIHSQHLLPCQLPQPENARVNAQTNFNGWKPKSWPSPLIWLHIPPQT